jgi:TusA-related sulfurtransferase
MNKFPFENELDLIGVVSPVCLLKCKSVLTQMRTGEVLEILLQDPDVVEELLKIIARSTDKVIQSTQEGDHYRIRLIKGETPNGKS